MATKSEIVEAVSRITGVSKAEAHRAVDAVFVTIADNLARGEDVRLTGFGSFSVANRAERTGFSSRFSVFRSRRRAVNPHGPGPLQTGGPNKFTLPTPP